MLAFTRNISVLSRRSIFTSAVLRNEVPKAASQLAVQSSCLAGTPLNLKVKKSGAEPVALEDHEYPEWLWTVLDAKANQEKLDADPVKKAKKEMRARNKKQIKLNNFMAQMK